MEEMRDDHGSDLPTLRAIPWERITRKVCIPPSQDKDSGVAMTGQTNVPDRLWSIVLAGGAVYSALAGRPLCRRRFL